MFAVISSPRLWPRFAWKGSWKVPTIEHIEFCLPQPRLWICSPVWLSRWHFILQSTVPQPYACCGLLSDSRILRCIFVRRDVSRCQPPRWSCFFGRQASCLAKSALRRDSFVIVFKTDQNFEPVTKLEPSFGTFFANGNRNACTYSSTSEHAKLKYSKKMQS